MTALIKTVDEAVKNIQALELYRTGSAEDKKFYKRIIEQGKIFVVLKKHNGYLFSTCKFAGYANNNREVHDWEISTSNGKKSTRNAEKTTALFKKMLGDSYSSGTKFEIIDNAYQDYCRNLAFSPSANNKVKRRYWLIEQESDDARVYYINLENDVASALKDSSHTRLSRLAKASKKPKILTVTTKIFSRNADVIAEVLIRAGGHCEECGKAAPFKRAKDGKPYLEVHHKVRLADDGDDTVENAVALCPNCHRKNHFGIKNQY